MNQQQKIKELESRNLQLEQIFNEALKEIEDLKGEVARLTEFNEEMQANFETCRLELEYRELLDDTIYDD